jgi:hypothetical protein
MHASNASLPQEVASRMTAFLRIWNNGGCESLGWSITCTLPSHGCPRSPPPAAHCPAWSVSTGSASPDPHSSRRLPPLAHGSFAPPQTLPGAALHTRQQTCVPCDRSHTALTLPRTRLLHTVPLTGALALHGCLRAEAPPRSANTPRTAMPLQCLQHTPRWHTLPPTGAPFGKRRMQILSSSACLS